jgi:hypothetical protein
MSLLLICGLCMLAYCRAKKKLLIEVEWRARVPKTVSTNPISVQEESERESNVERLRNVERVIVASSQGAERGHNQDQGTVSQAWGATLHTGRPE